MQVIRISIDHSRFTIDFVSLLMTIHEATFYLLKNLRSIYSESEASGITDLVMENLTGSKKAERMIYKNSAITEKEESRLHEYIERLMQNEPVQYVLGEAWFAGMRFKVNKNVLIPRPETDELVDWIVKEISRQSAIGNRQFSIIDIGTGSGCIPITLKKKIPNAFISAADVCSEAIFTASENAVDHDTEVDFILLDFLDEEKWGQLGKYDIIISNPPYVRQSEAQTMHERVIGFEPHLALFVPDNDALVFYRKLAEFSLSHLKDEGSLYVEINENLAKEVTDLFQSKGFSKVEIRTDMQAKQRMIKAMT